MDLFSGLYVDWRLHYVMNNTLLLLAHVFAFQLSLIKVCNLFFFQPGINTSPECVSRPYTSQSMFKFFLVKYLCDSIFLNTSPIFGRLQIDLYTDIVDYLYFYILINFNG